MTTPSWHSASERVTSRKLEHGTRVCRTDAGTDVSKLDEQDTKRHKRALASSVREG